MRIQILNLPAPPDQYPYALVFDQCGDQTFQGEDWEEFKASTGAKGVLIFPGTAEVV